MDSSIEDRVAGGHFPMVEDPAALAELLDRVGSG